VTKFHNENVLPTFVSLLAHLDPCACSVFKRSLHGQYVSLVSADVHEEHLIVAGHAGARLVVRDVVSEKFSNVLRILNCRFKAGLFDAASLALRALNIGLRNSC
jgi:hypothetical protein